MEMMKNVLKKLFLKLKLFFISLGAKTRLSDYKLNKTTIVQVVENLKRNGFVAIGEQKIGYTRKSDSYT